MFDPFHCKAANFKYTETFFICALEVSLEKEDTISAEYSNQYEINNSAFKSFLHTLGNNLTGTFKNVNVIEMSLLREERIKTN